jgi:hypothetical protein
MPRIHKIFFLLALFLASFSTLILFKQNVTDLAFLPAVSENSKVLIPPSGTEPCQQTWLRTAAGSANRSYFIPPEDVSRLLACDEPYVSLISAIQPKNYQAASMAVSLYPENPHVWFWLGDTIQTVAPATALAAFSHVVSLEPTNGLAWCRIGTIDEKVGQTQTATDAYLRCCLNSDPEVKGCFGAGQMMEKLGNLRQAIVYYRMSTWDKSLQRADVLESKLNPVK